MLCPEFQVLTYRTTNRDGYREYKSDPKICIHCPTRHLCPCAKDCVKTVQRHIWKDYEELADDARYTPKYQELYKRRKETIERVFADAKEKYAMRYTQYRGLAQVTNWVKLKFAAMNLKKLAIWLWREKLFPFISIPLCTLYDRTRPTHNPYTGFLDRLNGARGNPGSVFDMRMEKILGVWYTLCPVILMEGGNGYESIRHPSGQIPPLQGQRL